MTPSVWHSWVSRLIQAGMMFSATTRGMNLAAEYPVAYRPEDGTSQCVAKR